MLRLRRRTIEAIKPPPAISSFEWICANAVTKRGNPFDPYAYPWTKGICDSWDDPSCERIFFQAGSRLGKTELGLSLLLFSMARDPDISMIGGPTKEKVEQWLGDRFVPMVDGCNVTRNWLPPEHKRTRTKLRMLHGIIYGAWSGSPTTLGDLDPKYLFAFEISKFSKAQSEEADSLRLLLERGAEIPDRQVYCESTPTIFGKCRVNHYLRNGTNCRFHVPCPYCGAYQMLQRGSKDLSEGGLIWDHEEGGHSTPSLAYQTARYVCRACRREIHEEQRLSMVERGVWCPKGAMVNKRGKVIGEYNRSPDHTFQISRLYGPTFTFGSYARSFVEAIHDKDPEAYRSWLNNWAGICWSPHYALADWEVVADRLCTSNRDIGTCPSDTIFLTCGVDVQVDHWVYTITAWNNRSSGTVVRYGLGYSWEDIKEVITSPIKHEDGGPDIVPMFTLIDARDGNRTDEVRAFCKSINSPTGPFVLPCMGAATTSNKAINYTKTQLDKDGVISRKSKRRGLVGFDLIMVNTNYYQNWIHNCLDRRKPGDDDSITFPLAARYDKELFDQLLSEKPEWTTTASGNNICRWVKTSEHIVNDMRDALRYARCAADVYVANNWDRVPPKRTVRLASQKPEVSGRKEHDKPSGKAGLKCVTTKQISK